MELKLVLLLFLIGNFRDGLSAEHVCSKFDYEMKTLEAMLRTEQRVEKTVEEMKIIKEMVSKELLEIKDFESKTTAELDKTKEKIQRLVFEQMELLKGPGIAFSVGNPLESLKNGIPTFNNEITNVGGAYDMDSGVFTCPVDGIYVFSFTVASQTGWDTFCSIQRSDVGSDHVIARSHSDNSFTTSSNMVYFLLTKGDTVSLGGCIGFGGILGHGNLVTFSGALIRQN